MHYIEQVYKTDYTSSTCLSKTSSILHLALDGRSYPSPVSPSLIRKMAVQAIIAALSVHSEIGG